VEKEKKESEIAGKVGGSNIRKGRENAELAKQRRNKFTDAANLASSSSSCFDVLVQAEIEGGEE